MKKYIYIYIYIYVYIKIKYIFVTTISTVLTAVLVKHDVFCLDVHNLSFLEKPGTLKYHKVYHFGRLYVPATGVWKKESLLYFHEN